MPLDENLFVSQINEKFAHLKGRPVIIYGLGVLTRLLIHHKDALVFSLAALLDRDLSSGSFIGLPIIKASEAAVYASDIIIAAQLTKCALIYKRIAHLDKGSITVYYINGEKPSELKNGSYFREQINRLQENMQRLSESLERYDVISFDIFDTLLLRSCLLPETVFDILEERNGQHGFAGKRAKAEASCIREGKDAPDLLSIYETLYRQDAIDGDFIQAMEEELRFEELIITARPDMLAIFKQALKLKKTVILVSDMYMTVPQLQRLLIKNGIEGYEKIFVSCEQKSSKSKGDIWGIVRKAYPGCRILHIGDNYTSDYYVARDAGIEAFAIDDPIRLLRAFGLEQCFDMAETSADFITLGLMTKHILRLINDGGLEDGHIKIPSWHDLGCLFFGPMTYSFVEWIRKEAILNREELLLFSARDGFLWIKIYELIQKKFGETGPEALYFYTSRIGLISSVVQGLPDIKMLLNLYNFSGVSIREFIFICFDLRLEEDAFNGRMVTDVSFEELSENLKVNGLDRILSNTERFRKNYLEYMRNCGMFSKERVGLTDFITTNRSLFMMDRLTGKKLRLYNYAADKINSCKFDNEPLSDTRSYYSGYDPFMASDIISKYLYLCELVYTSPEGQFLHMDNNLNPVFKELIQDNSYVAKVQHGVEAYVSAMLALGSPAASPALSEKLFGQISSGVFQIKEGLIDNLYFDESINKRKYKYEALPGK